MASEQAGSPVLPRYFPDGSAMTTTFEEFIRLVRSPSVIAEPPGEREPLSRGAIPHLNGDEHMQRRRVVNRLVRPEALDAARERQLLPGLARQLHRIRATPAPDGRFRTDLVPFSHKMFMQFAAAMIGLRGVETDEGVDLLQQLFEPLQFGIRVKFSLDDHGAILARAAEAKQEYVAAFYAPSSAEAERKLAAGEELDTDLISLIAQRLDPRWADEEVAINDTLIFLAGALETSAGLIVHSVDELARWLPERPEDEALIDDLEFLSCVVMEALRLHPSAPSIGRIATESIETPGGDRVEDGQWIACLHLPANTDQAVYGETAHLFDPHREVPPGVPRYGTSFGTGRHQCLGLRVVLGNEGIGAHAYALRELLRAGIEPDPDHPARKEPSERDFYASYPVRFTRLERAS